MKRYYFRRSLLSGISAVALLFLTSMPAHAIYREEVSLWPNGRVRVCWEAGKATDGTGVDDPASNHPNFANLSRAIRGAVSAWSFAAHIDFVGWGDCSLDPFENPYTLAISWTTGGGDSFQGPNSQVWTRMQLNPADLTNQLTNRPDAFRGVVLHEFAHALGFSHEMRRPDWVVPTIGNPCIDHKGTKNDFFSNYYQTPSDLTSITTYTYCAAQKTGELSPWDIIGIQNAYGRRGTEHLSGNFNGDRKRDILVQSDSGLGILTVNGDTFTSILVAPDGSWFGGWRYSSIDNQILGITDFNKDNRDDILIKSPWGIGILTLSADNTSLTSLMAAPNGSLFGGWRLSSMKNKIAGTADFDDDGQQDILITSDWGIGLLTLRGSSLDSVMVVPNGTSFDGWVLSTGNDRFGRFGDFDGDGQTDIVIQSNWGMGILTFDGSTLQPLMLAANGSKFGTWTFNNKTDRIAGTGSYDGYIGQHEILMTRPTGIAILRLSGTKLTAIAQASHGTGIQNSTGSAAWFLDAKTDLIGGIGDVDFSGTNDILVQSGWGIGLIKVNGASFQTLALSPNGSMFGNWNYDVISDRVIGVGYFNGLSFSSQLLVKGMWGSGLGVLEYRNGAITSLAISPNNSWIGGWLYNPSTDRFGPSRYLY
ncbi:MAG: hypothetical protein L0Z68_02050 [Gammaproteobacteria bacterium]|nr:hypothetical protein [Gammaproteobacteria bacterium]